MTTQSSTVGFPTPPTIKDGKEVYNMIMGKIEPELTLENLPKNGEKYAEETKKQTLERAQRYKAAFIEYKTRYSEYKLKQDDEVRAYGRTAIKAVEDQSSTQEENEMLNLESAISNS